MKKILSLALAMLMLVSALPVAYAAENEANYDAGTQIELIGSGTEQYTVTVPASLSLRYDEYLGEMFNPDNENNYRMSRMKYIYDLEDIYDLDIVLDKMGCGAGNPEGEEIFFTMCSYNTYYQKNGVL